MKILNKKRGQAAILMAMSLIAIVSLMAVVVDTGRIYVEHTKLQRAVDSAVLAAAQELPPGKNLSEEDIKELIYKALAYNLNTDEIHISKDDNVSSYLLPSDNAYETVAMKKDAYSIENDAVDIQFLVPADSIDQEKTVVSVTIHKLLKTRLAMILGYNEWTISAQRIARNGPIASVPEFIPIAVISKVDGNNQPVKIPYKQTVRLVNTTHVISDTSPQYHYIPFRDFNGINFNDPQVGVAGKFLPGGIGKRTIFTNGVLHETQLANQELSQKIFQGMCDGIQERIRQGAAGQQTTGCWNSDETIGDVTHNPDGTITVGNNRPHNITSINMSKRFSYGDDPRLVLVPIVQVTNGATKPIQQRSRTVKVIGFGMFFIQYAHYTSYPPGGEKYPDGPDDDTDLDRAAMVEYVGYFTDSIMEGPIDPKAYDYGLTGVQYVDPNDEEVFDIHI